MGMKFRIMHRNTTAVLIALTVVAAAEIGKITEKFRVHYYVRGKKLETRNKQSSLNHMQWALK
jgi:uncharacterized protein YpuA (DUF1002 family)